MEEAISACCTEAEQIAKRETTPVYHLYKKQKEIEVKGKQLNALTEIFFNQSNQWIQLIDEVNDACKELGDVENALELIQQDIDVIQLNIG